MSPPWMLPTAPQLELEEGSHVRPGLFVRCFSMFFPNSSDIHRLWGSILWWRPKRVAGQPFGVGEMDLPRIRFPSNKATAVLSVLGIQYSSSRTVTVGQQLHLTNSDWPGKSSSLKTWRLFWPKRRRCEGWCITWFRYGSEPVMIKIDRSN